MASLWFSDGGQIKILQGYMPVGRIYKKAYTVGSNFYNIVRWQAKQFEYLLENFNKTFKSIFLCSDANSLHDRWKRDYNIPNSIFFQSKEFNKRDVFVLRYLMRGNTEWHYRAVANIYNIDVVISPSPTRNPNVFVISFFALKQLGVPYEIPHKLGGGRHIEKIKSIYAAMKPAQCKILYVPLGHSIGGTDTTDRIPSSVPHYLGIKSGETTIFDETPKPRIKFCEGLTEQ